MAQTDYIVRAGVGFDIDRKSGAQAISTMDNIVGQMQNTATKRTAKGFQDRAKEYNKTIKDVATANKKADQDLVKGTQQVAKRAADAIAKARPKPLPAAKAAKMDTSAIKKYSSDYKSTMKGMTTAYKKFASEAEKAGIKVAKTQGGWGTKAKVEQFAGGDPGNRKRQIDLTKTMVMEQKRLMKGLDKESEEYREQKSILDALENQQKDMISIDRDMRNVERKHARERKKNSDALKAAGKKKKQMDQAENRRLKINIKAIKEAGAAIGGYASSIGSTLKNAFVIGTAAAGAFFYKMQPVVEQVMEFEKELMNAQSIFQVHRAELHELSDVVTEFGLQYGIAYDTAVKGLYQYASAGVEAAEANEMLAHTLKLSMAVQGDHEALAKLTTQTIMGFSMEFSDAAEITDKFAHSINKSLIEWDDLASSVKFALPFFISTGQSIDQLLGSLEILTNRALEAGIAGRGLRQALAEFTQHAEDNTAAFHKMGVEILDMQGNMKPLTDIAQQFKDLMGPAVNDMDIMMALMEDLNIRGATAFVHLVQNAEDFQTAVDDLANSAGSATEMAEIQQQSLSMQIQRVKNALLAPFLLSDEIGEANDTLNEFTFVIKELVDEFVGFFIIENEFGNTLTQQGKDIKTFAVEAIKVAVEIIREFKDIFLESGTGLKTFTSLLNLATIPLKVLLKVLNFLGPRAIEYLIYLKLANKLLPINAALQWYQTRALMANTAAISGNVLAESTWIASTKAVLFYIPGKIAGLYASATAWQVNWMAMTMGVAGIALVIGGLMSMSNPLKALTLVALGLAAAFAAMWVASTAGTATATILAGLAAVSAGVAAVGATAMATRSVTGAAAGAVTSAIPESAIVSSANKLSSGTPQIGSSAGSVINIYGDIYDEQGFQNVLASHLAGAVRTINDGGGI